MSEMSLPQPDEGKARKIDLNALADVLDQGGQHQQAAELRARGQRQPTDKSSLGALIEQKIEEEKNLLEASQRPPHIQDSVLKPHRVSPQELAEVHARHAKLVEKSNQPSLPTGNGDNK